MYISKNIEYWKFKKHAYVIKIVFRTCFMYILQKIIANIANFEWNTTLKHTRLISFWVL